MASRILSPVAVDELDHPFNTNADVAAGAIASALRARRLVYLCDVPGLLSGRRSGLFAFDTQVERGS